MKCKLNILFVIAGLLYACPGYSAPVPSAALSPSPVASVAPAAISNHEVVTAYKLVIRYNPAISILRLAEWSPASLSKATVDIGYIDQPQVEADQNYIHLIYMKLDTRNQDTVQYKLYRNSQQLLQSYQFSLPPKTDVKSIALRLNGPEVHAVISAVDLSTLQSTIYYYIKPSATSAWRVSKFLIAGQLGEGLELDIVSLVNYAVVAYTRSTATGRDVSMLEIDHINRTSTQTVVASGSVFSGKLATHWVKPISFRFSPHTFTSWLNYAQADSLNNPQVGVSMDEGFFAMPFVWAPKTNFAGAWGSSVSYRHLSGFNVATVEGQGGLFFGGRDLYLYESPSGVTWNQTLLDTGPLFLYPSITRQDMYGNFYVAVGAMTNPFLGIGEIRLYNPQGSYALLEPSGGPVYFKEIDCDLRY